MPRIQAPTVREHHAAQRKHLLAAARQIIERSGPRALTFGQLADSAGLARPSVYQYFSTRDELLIALLDESFDEWYGTLKQSLTGHRSPQAQIEAFLVAHLRLVRRGKHGLEALLGQSELSREAHQHVAARHRHILSLLEPAIGRLSMGDTGLCADLIMAALQVAMGRVAAGKPVVPTARRLTAFIAGGLRALE